MATSNSYNLSTSRDALIASALRKIGILADGQTASASQITTGAEVLNFMVKAWAADGMPLWALKYINIYPHTDTNELIIYNNTAGANVSEERGLTKLTAAAAALATSLSVSITAATDVQGTTANSDFIGIELDNGNMHYTTISSGGGTASLVITTGIPTAAAAGNRVYFFTTKAEKPLKLLDVWMIQALDSTRIPINIVSEAEINSLGNLTSEASYVNQVSYVPLISTGRLTVYPRWQDGAYYMLARCQYPHEDFDAANDEPAFPQEYYRALSWNLALELGADYQVPQDLLAFVTQMAMKTKMEADSFGAENASFMIQPDIK